MASSALGPSPRAIPRASHSPKRSVPRSWRVKMSKDGSDSYLDMWKSAVDRERKAAEFRRMTERSPSGGGEVAVDVEKKSEEFRRILEVSKDERDRIQRMQVIDRAAAAIAAARALLKDRLLDAAVREDDGGGSGGLSGGDGGAYQQQQQSESEHILLSQSGTPENGVPGPDFWSWTPPSVQDSNSNGVSGIKAVTSVYPTLTKPTALKERSMDVFSIPFESKFAENIENPSLPPFQSFVQVESSEDSASVSTQSLDVEEEDDDISVSFSDHAVEIAHALDEDKVADSLLYGVNPDGSRWWKETGIEQRPDGVICRWTMSRGVSADESVEWQEKFWEAADELGYKELGSEKSGRDATGSVWREFWRESMRQDNGLVQLEKTADKWGKNGKGDEWHEKWWEHYGASGQVEKWAHKWCSIDPTTELDEGHAHIWNERWGEKYDGQGGSIKYTDKWAERRQGDGWIKWGDKWDENFDPNSHGVKQGETWWEGKHGERWNRTWGERHNGSGWVHKYGKSSSGEHWDTHLEQETWYEKFPHYGFYHCFENSVQLRAVKKPSEAQEP